MLISKKKRRTVRVGDLFFQLNFEEKETVLMCWYLEKKKSESWQSLFSSWNWNKNGSNLFISKLDTCLLPLAASRRSPSDKVDCFNGGPRNGCKDILFASNVTADVCALTVRGERPLTDFQEKLEICANRPDSPPSSRVGWDPPKYKKN